MFVTHLECSATGQRHEAGRLHNLSRAGKPLLVRYDLDAVGKSLSRAALASRRAGMWRWRELLPHPEGAEPISLGEPETPIMPLTRIGGPNLLVKDEGHGSRVVGALTVRVGLTAITVALVAWGFYSGQLVSHVTW